MCGFSAFHLTNTVLWTHMNIYTNSQFMKVCTGFRIESTSPQMDTSLNNIFLVKCLVMTCQVLYVIHCLHRKKVVSHTKQRQ